MRFCRYATAFRWSQSKAFGSMGWLPSFQSMWSRLLGSLTKYLVRQHGVSISTKKRRTARENMRAG